MGKKKKGKKLERYAELAAAVAGRPAHEREAALEAVGATPAEWERARDKWQERLPYDHDLYRRFARLYRQALERQVGAPCEIDQPTYVEISARLRSGQEVSQAIADTGLSEREYEIGSAIWQDRMWDSPRLAGLFEARARVRTAQLEHPEPPLPPPEAARLVFAQRCPGCGAHKVTRPRTPYVYCDYCARLFDYDWEHVRGELHGLDLRALFEVLVQSIRDDLRRCREAGDWDGYRALWQWAYAADMEIVPGTWSPRIGDAAYREAMIDWSVETCVARNTSEELKGACDRLKGAIWALGEAGPLEAPARRLAALRDQLDVETRIYAEHGLIDRHPDGIDAETYRRINLAIHLRACVAGVEGEARSRAIEASGLGRAVVDVPPVDATRALCGLCGGALLVAADARQLVCEGCGAVLEGGQRRFDCPGCGAPVLTVAGEHRLQCGYCDATFSITG